MRAPSQLPPSGAVLAVRASASSIRATSLPSLLVPPFYDRFGKELVRLQDVRARGYGSASGGRRDSALHHIVDMCIWISLVRCDECIASDYYGDSSHDTRRNADLHSKELSLFADRPILETEQASGEKPDHAERTNYQDHFAYCYHEAA